MHSKGQTGGPPSIVEVARAAGVSTATAGRVLGGYGQASAASRKKVEEAAQRLGYRPNGLARSLIQGSTETIGVIVTDVGNSFFAQAVRGIADVVRAGGFEILLANTDSDPEAEQRAIQVMWEKRVDGLIIAPEGPDSAGRLRTLVDGGLPVVLLDRPLPALPQVDQVLVNNTACARRAVDHLIRLGHRRIAVVSEASRDFSRLLDPSVDGDGERPSAARLAGYLSALQRAGIRPDPDLVVQAPYDRAAAERATARLLRRNPSVTALFCTDNILTSGALAAVQRSGRACPEEISLVGFDDQEWTTLVRPQLTVVRQPHRELGAAAAKQLLARVQAQREGGGPADDEAVHLRLQAKLVRRASTAPAPASGA
ncbi:LacI family DNA-binding transcriptional regulator [Actinoallomurus soli]|uniref:LacI family DNA-binding transcriptional regulator n=1 Tax=Actinoallomurus soli TaxID=2952535 RepID=UPI0020921C18|nr:LacI family DNA-binding transcriptional regulator [Actinoallomurus soli]MCO5974246.1 LacI family transcriptional regulator [Actinoallomurus soli]